MRIDKKTVMAVAAGLFLAGGIQAMPTADYVKKAGASDLYETKSSKLVLGTTKNASIRKFADEMVMDHAKSTAMVKAAAMKSGLHPKPPMLTAEQQGMIAKLTAATGTARDSLYIQQQKTAHQQALATHQDYAATGDKPALKMAAGKIVPVVEKHISMLDGMPAM